MSELREGEMAIGELSKRTGVPTATINFYVKEGILPAPRKLNRTRAAYGDKHERLLNVARRAVRSGLPLSQIRRYVDFFGTDEEGIAKLEGIGSLHPYPRPWNDPDREPIDVFEPEDRAALARRTGVDEALIEQLEDWGVLVRDRNGLFGQSHAVILLNIKSLLRDEVPLEKLAFLRDLAAAIRPAADVLAFLRSKHAVELVERKVRFRDLMAPFLAVFAGALELQHHAIEPAWRDVGEELAERVLKARPRGKRPAAKKESTPKKKSTPKKR